MGTRSTIALEFADGSVQQVYCHWDGYLEHNGQILLDHYSDPFKLAKVMELGDLSSLNENIGEKHPFDPPGKYDSPEYEFHRNKYGKMCKFYGRDRGEKDVNARSFSNYAEYLSEGQSEEYNYILRQVNGKAEWFVETYTIQRDAFVPLTTAIAINIQNMAEE